MQFIVIFHSDCNDIDVFVLKCTMNQIYKLSIKWMQNPMQFLIK